MAFFSVHIGLVLYRVVGLYISWKLSTIPEISVCLSLVYTYSPPFSIAANLCKPSALMSLCKSKFTSPCKNASVASNASSNCLISSSSVYRCFRFSPAPPPPFVTVQKCKLPKHPIRLCTFQYSQLLKPLFCPRWFWLALCNSFLHQSMTSKILSKIQCPVHQNL